MSEDESKPDCPKGYKQRRSFTRRFRNSVVKHGFSVTRKGHTYKAFPKHNTAAHVPATCVEQPLRKGDLMKYGYVFYKGHESRHRALRRAVVQYGKSRVSKRLDIASKLYGKAYPAAGKTFEADERWVTRTFMNKNI